MSATARNPMAEDLTDADVARLLAEAPTPPRCTSCGHAVTVCVDYLRRDQGLPQPTPRRWVCGCGATGTVGG